MASTEYATNDEIRMKAGFEKATNLEDKYVVTARRDAVKEINAACSALYAVPFDPVPGKIRTLTIKIAAYPLKCDAFGSPP